MFDWIKKGSKGGEEGGEEGEEVREQKEEEKPVKSAKRQKLTALVRGIQHAASSANQMLAQQYFYIMQDFFDKQEDGRLVAKMTYIQLDKDNIIPVPLISLVKPQNLGLKEMKVDLSIRIEEAHLKEMPTTGSFGEDEKITDRLGFSVNMSPRSKGGGEENRRPSDVLDIEMTFKSDESPEAIMRVIDEFTNLIDPKKIPLNKELDTPEPADSPESDAPEPEEKNEEDGDSNKFCKNCGQPSDGKNFCSNCGHKLTDKDITWE